MAGAIGAVAGFVFYDVFFLPPYDTLTVHSPAELDRARRLRRRGPRGGPGGGPAQGGPRGRAASHRRVGSALRALADPHRRSQPVPAAVAHRCGRPGNLLSDVDGAGVAGRGRRPARGGGVGRAVLDRRRRDVADFGWRSSQVPRVRGRTGTAPGLGRPGGQRAAGRHARPPGRAAGRAGPQPAGHVRQPGRAGRGPGPTARTGHAGPAARGDRPLAQRADGCRLPRPAHAAGLHQDGGLEHAPRGRPTRAGGSGGAARARGAADRPPGPARHQPARHDPHRIRARSSCDPRPSGSTSWSTRQWPRWAASWPPNG